jgi:hypothetical protein
MRNSKNLTSFALVYYISFLQLVCLSVYIYRNGYFFLDVPHQARAILFVRSVIHAAGYICFVHSLKFVSPVCALCLQGTTCVMNISLFRVRRAYFRVSEFGYILPAFAGAVFCLCVSSGLLEKFGIDVVVQRDDDFKKGSFFALASGIALGMKGRIS